jgi:hypothetical protein
MADPTYPPTGETIGNEPDDRAAPTGVPRWVKVFAAVILALVLLFVGLKLTGIGGDHGPGRHGGGDGQEQHSGTDDGEHDPSDWDH